MSDDDDFSQLDDPAFLSRAQACPGGTGAHARGQGERLPIADECDFDLYLAPANFSCPDTLFDLYVTVYAWPR